MNVNKDISGLQLIYEKLLNEAADTVDMSANENGVIGNPADKGRITINIKGKPTVFTVPLAEVNKEPSEDTLVLKGDKYITEAIPAYSIVKWGQLEEGIIQPKKQFILHLPDQTTLFCIGTTKSDAKLHRADGPAALYLADGTYNWWFDGVELSRDEYLTKLRDENIVDEATLATISMVY